MQHRYTVALLALLLATPAAADGQRYNYGRNLEHQTSDTTFDRDSASLGWSVVEQDYTGTSPCYIKPKLASEPELSIFYVGIDGNYNGPDYGGYENTHNPCTGYDYYPYINQTTIETNSTQVSSLYTHLQQAREFGILLDAYQDVDKTDGIRLRMFTDRGDYYGVLDDWNVVADGSHIQTAFSCVSDAQCATGYKCYPEGFGGTSGYCATDAGGLEGLGDGFYIQTTSGMNHSIIMWMDGAVNDFDGNSDYLNFSIHHEFGHFLHFQYGQPWSNDPSSDQRTTWEMAAEAFARLSFISYMAGEGHTVNIDDRPAAGWAFSDAFADGQQRQNTGRAFADGIFEIVYSVDCSELGASGCQSLTESGAASRDDFSWGSTALSTRARDVGRALAYAMDVDTADTPTEFVDKFLLQFKNIFGATLCEEAEDVMHWHGFTGANC